MSSLEFKGISKFFLDLCSQSEPLKGKESELSDIIDDVSQRAIAEQQYQRKSIRDRKPTPKIKESVRDSKARAAAKKAQGIKRKGSEKRKVEGIKRSERNKRKRLIKDVIKNLDHLHHYPITNPEINEVLYTLNDQRSTIKKLSKKEVADLETAIQLSNFTGAYPGIRIESLGEVLGNGAFLDPLSLPLKPGTVLGIYSGEYKLYQIDHLNDADLSYAFELTDIICLDEEEHLQFFGNLDTFTDNGDYVIYSDALHKGNWTRNLNHGGKYANCTADLVRYEATMEDGAKRVSTKSFHDLPIFSTLT